MPFSLPESSTTTAGSFVTGIGYQIVSVGSTDFTTIGAASNTVGVFFTATGAGSGSGTAKADADTDAAIADPDSNSGNLVITNITGSLYRDSGTINLSNVSGISNPDPNNTDQPYTKTATNTLTVSGSFTGAADASVTVKYPILNDGAVNQIYGSCVFSDPNSSDNESYILMATNVSVSC